MNGEVRTRQAKSPGGRWFTVRWVPGRPGAELVTRIPGSTETVTAHATRDEADAAARAAYEEYETRVNTIKETAS